MKIKKQHFISVLFITFAAVFVIMAVWRAQTPVRNVSAGNSQDILPTFTETELKKFDGTDPSLPIYIGFQGNVYDVSAGKKYYQTGGNYHFLAGRDSTAELNIAGGGIIKTKYPIVGKLIK